MMQGDYAFQGQKCARCRQAIQSDPACDEYLWYHRTCLAEGTRALQRAHELAACFGVARASPLPGRGTPADADRVTGSRSEALPL